jgi:hypothetical protein
MLMRRTWQAMTSYRAWLWLPSAALVLICAPALARHPSGGRDNLRPGLTEQGPFLCMIDCDDQDEPERAPGRPDRGHRMRGRGFPPGLGPRLFQPSEEDFGPLKPGELEELAAFAEKHLPRFHREMTRLRERHPERYQAALKRLVPRLRQLRRIFEESPKVGEAFRLHAEAGFDVRRRVEGLRGVSPDSDRYRELKDELQEAVRRHVRAEAEVLGTLADEMEAQREQNLARRVAAVLEQDADLSDLPQELQDSVSAYHAADTDLEREVARARVELLLGQQYDAKVRAVRQHQADLTGNIDQVVRERTQRMLKMAERRDHRDRPERGRDDRGREPRGQAPIR